MTMTNGKVPTESFLKHLKDREGSVDRIFLDTKDKATSGVGHLMSNDEMKTYGVAGYADEIINNVKYKVAIDKDGKVIKPGSTKIDEWLRADATKYYNYGSKLAAEAGITDQGMIEALGNVSFQLGESWHREGSKKFPKAWKAIKSGDYTQAVKEIKESNAEGGWMKDTPTRANDFIDAINAYGKKMKPQDYAIEEMKAMDDPLGLSYG